jgi:hypothetical protein
MAANEMGDTVTDASCERDVKKKENHSVCKSCVTQLLV